MFNDPVRTLVPLLGETENVTVPLPVPEPPETIEIYVALLVAVQEQPAAVATENVPVPPLDPTDRVCGETA